MKLFWKSHDPCAGAWSTQYKAVLWTHGEAQAKTARAFVAAWQKKNERKVTTEIVPAPTFWIAEDYHQKYRLRAKKALLNALFEKAPTDEQIRESTITARVNGWISGYGSPDEIAAEIKRLNLSETARKALAKEIGRRAFAIAK